MAIFPSRQILTSHEHVPGLGFSLLLVTSYFLASYGRRCTGRSYFFSYSLSIFDLPCWASFGTSVKKTIGVCLLLINLVTALNILIYRSYGSKLMAADLVFIICYDCWQNLQELFPHVRQTVQLLNDNSPI